MRAGRHNQKFPVLLLGLVLLTTIFVLRCGPSESDRHSPSIMGASKPATRKKIEDVLAVQGKECRLSDYLVAEKRIVSASGPVLWARGGGWENGQTLEAFSALAGAGYFAIVLSAVPSTGAQNSAYFLNYYRARLPKRSLVPLTTQAGASAQDASKIKIIEGASGIIITGGYPDYLRHLPGTGVGNAIVAALRRGIPVYTNSASISLAGNVFAWNLATTYSAPGVGLGLSPFPMLSHLDEPSIYKQYPTDLWYLVPSKSPRALGLTSATVAEIRGDLISVLGNDPLRNQMYWYDARYPRTKHCDIWFLTPGEGLEISTGKLLDLK